MPTKATHFHAWPPASNPRKSFQNWYWIANNFDVKEILFLRNIQSKAPEFWTRRLQSLKSIVIELFDSRVLRSSINPVESATWHKRLLMISLFGNKSSTFCVRVINIFRYLRNNPSLERLHNANHTTNSNYCSFSLLNTRYSPRALVLHFYILLLLLCLFQFDRDLYMCTILHL